jgi:cytochrome c oxidase subunit 3
MIDGKLGELSTTVTHNPWGAASGVMHDGHEVYTPGPVAFGGYFFGITGFHGFHVFSGVIINIIMLVMAINGVFDRKGHYQMIEKAGLYWHFVDLVWVFVFLCFYLI